MYVIHTRLEKIIEKIELIITIRSSYYDIIPSIVILGMFNYVIWFKDIIVIIGVIINMLLTYGQKGEIGQLCDFEKITFKSRD